jgi:putative ABC transport system ATP-binding protein
MMASPFVRLHSVTKSYRRGRETIAALRDVSFAVNAREFVILSGPSGSGKTTLLNLIAALDRPDAGEITVAASDVSRLSFAAAAKYRNQRVGIIFQSYSLLPQLTAMENVLLPMIPGRRWNRTRALELLEAVGLGDRSAHRPAELSGGEQQRVAIARALANDPALILADEPTGNLDDENAAKIMALLCSSCRSHGRTLILVTHDPAARHRADATFELDAGTLTRTQGLGGDRWSAQRKFKSLE